jgi:membrane-associated phospholipid phosphatase
MKKRHYIAIHDYISARPRLCRLVVTASKTLPLLVYAGYPLLLAYLVIFDRSQLLRAIVVPAAGFLLCTVIRAAINAPRPYEAMGIPALAPKDTQGKSFPSRHAACAAVIGVTALFTAPPLGVFLCLVALLTAASRVLAGVHYLRDVVCGLALGGAVALAGYLL